MYRYRIFTQRAASLSPITNVSACAECDFHPGELVASIQPEQTFPDNPQDSFGYEVHFFETTDSSHGSAILRDEFDLANVTTHRRCINGS